MIRHCRRAVPIVTACLLFVTNLSAAQAPDLAARAQAVVAQLAAKQFDTIEAAFNDRMRAALPAGRLKATWTTIVSQAGEFKRTTGTRTQTSGASQIGIVTCEFEHATLDAQVVFDAEGKLAGLALRPPAPAPVPYAAPAYVTPGAFTDAEQPVGSGDWVLPGTLTLPSGPGPFPAVVLVAGSGPLDRDETVAANKPFKDLAGGLASRGIASLRYDKRTKVYASKLAGTADFTVQQEVVADVLEAVKTLRANAHIDGARVFVIGHSLGAMLIPRIGAAEPTLAGLLVMAGPARSIEEGILEQTRYLAMADGTITPEEQAGIDRAAALVAKIKALTPEDARSAAGISGVPAAYWLDLRGYDPPAAARALKAPMLILQGERDYQVTMPEFARWRTALAGRSNVTFHTYPELNHLFIGGTGKSLPAEYAVPGHVAEEVVRDIAEWIHTVGR